MTLTAKLIALEKEVEILSGRVSVLKDTSLVDFVRSCRDVLTGTFRGELRQMVDFGFEVVNLRAKAARSLRVKTTHL